MLRFLSVETSNSPSGGSPSLARDVFEGHGPAAPADFEEVVEFSGGGSRWPEMAWTCRGRERPAGAGVTRAVRAGSRVWARGGVPIKEAAWAASVRGEGTRPEGEKEASLCEGRQGAGRIGFAERRGSGSKPQRGVALPTNPNGSVQ